MRREKKAWRGKYDSNYVIVRKEIIYFLGYPQLEISDYI